MSYLLFLTSIYDEYVKVPHPWGIAFSRHTSESDHVSESSPTMIHHTGVLHAACRDGSVNISIYQIVNQWLNKEFCYDKFMFTRFSTLAAWTEQFGETTPISPNSLLPNHSFPLSCKQVNNKILPINKWMWIPTTNLMQQEQRLEPPKSIFYATDDPAGVDITPQTTATVPGGLLALLQNRFQGGDC